MIDGLLDKRQQADLLMFLKDGSWEAVEKIAQAMQADWKEQTMKVDYRSVQDDTAVKDLISRQGMIRGIDALLFYLRRWREKTEAEAAKRVAMQNKP